MSTRARCRTDDCPNPFDGDVPEYGPPLRCPGCGKELVTSTEEEEHEAYPPTRFDDSNDHWPIPQPDPAELKTPPRNSWRPTNGSVFAGRYYIIRKIAQGGMGAVYEAHDNRFDRVVALKIPDLSKAGPDAIERFLREARAMAQLMLNPNICTVLDVDNPEGGVPYLTMEFIVGQTLSSQIQPQFPVDEAIKIVGTLASALAFAHSKGIIHRDLKPDNVMIRDDGTPVLMDFGLVRRDTDERITVANTLMGTLPYMSPEQVRGDTQAIGTASDVYGLGVILYELLTGRRPFKGRSEIAIITQIVNMNPDPPSDLREGLDPDLEAVCLKAMAKIPADRQSSMAELARTLLELTPRHSGPQRPPKPQPQPGPGPGPVETPGPKPETKKTRSGWWKIGSMIVTLFLLAIVVGLSWLMRSGPEKGPETEITPEKSSKELSSDSNKTLKKAEGPDQSRSIAAIIDPLPKPPPPVKAPTRREFSSRTTRMVLIEVEPGQFPMGSSRGPDAEKPSHPVTIRRPFFLGQSEVTQAEYQQVMGKNPSHFQGGERLPVESVNWFESVQFCNKLSLLDGLPPFYTIEGENVGVKDWNAPGYRLPTEAEWEFACRAGQTGEYGSKDDDSDLPQLAWFRSNSQVDGLYQTHPDPPTLKPMHPLGLRNMQGNVAEWSWDRYHPYDEREPSVDPTGPTTGDTRVVRGGSYASEASQLRPADRQSEKPSTTLRRTGFRVARNAR